MRLSRWFKTLARSESGAAAVEYGILVALIAAVIVMTVKPIGHRVECLFAELVREAQEGRLFPGKGHGPPGHANDPFGNEDDCP